MAATQDPQVETFEEFDEDDRLLLESHVAKNQSSEPEKFTVLYYIISAVTVLAISYLFQSVLDLNFLEPLNFLLFLVSGGATAYLLSESYLQAFETEQFKAISDANGLWIRELDAKMGRKADKIRNKAFLENKVVTAPRTALEIFQADNKPVSAWKTLSKEDKQVYFDQELAEECNCLGLQVADLKHLQYQQVMGKSLFGCNVVFCGLATVLACFVMRAYDARVNYLLSTFVCGVITQLAVKRNDEAVKAAKKNN